MYYARYQTGLSTERTSLVPLYGKLERERKIGRGLESLRISSLSLRERENLYICREYWSTCVISFCIQLYIFFTS